MPDRRDIRLKIERGDGPSFDIAAVKEDGTAQDITGSTLWFTAKHRLTDIDDAAVIRKSTTDGSITIVDGPGGIARVRLSGADTQGMTSLIVLHWDVQAKDPAGAIITLARGRLFIRPDVTRAIA